MVLSKPGMSHNIIIKMSRTQLKITHHTNNWEKWTFPWERQSTDVNTEMISVLELSDKNFKIIIIKMLQWAVIDSHETNDNLENLTKEMQGIKKKQIEITELKNTTT